MKLLHDNGYSDVEKLAFKEIIFSNLIQSIKVLIEAADKLGIALANPENEKYKKELMQLPHQLEGDSLPSNVGAAVKALWSDGGIQTCYSRANEFQLNDSAN